MLVQRYVDLYYGVVNFSFWVVFLCCVVIIMQVILIYFMWIFGKMWCSGWSGLGSEMVE